MNDRPAVAIKGVSKRFKAGVTALSEIDLEVQRRDFVSLIGPSGCGKSTLLRIVGDLVEPSVGTVEVNGKPAHRARLDHDYGIAFQEAVLYDWRTVAKNIALPLELLRWSREKRARRVDELLELVELDGFEDHHPWQLSGGMQQRVSIARALSFDPALLLMDEPFGALDEMTRERLNLELLRIWSASGSTVIFVTHSIPEAVFLSTRVVVTSARLGRVSGIVEVDLLQDVGTGMLEDGIFVRGDWIKDKDNHETAKRFLAASFRGWIYCRDHVNECTQIVLDNGPTLGKGHQTWQMNEINALIWPAPNGIGVMNKAAYKRTTQIAQEFGVIKKPPSPDAYRTDLAQDAVDEISASGEDVYGKDFKKVTVKVTPGGN